MQIIRPGKYCSLDTIDTSEDSPKKIIEIVGIDPRDQNYWLDSDNKRYSDDDLSNNWVLVAYSHAYSSPSNNNIRFGEISDVPRTQFSQQLATTNDINAPAISASVASATTSNIPHTATVVKQQRTEDDIIERCKMPDQSLFRDINISIVASLDIDTNRIQQLISLLNLDINYIIENLTDRMMNKLTMDTDSIRRMVKRQITDSICQPVQHHTVAEESVSLVRSQPSESNTNIPAQSLDLDLEISQLENKLNQYLTVAD